MSTNVIQDKPLCDAYKSFLQYIPSQYHVTGQCNIPEILIPQINDKDPLNFPLSVPIVDKLLQASKPSQFGKGTETTFDENIRTCEELDCAHFTVNTETLTDTLESIRCNLMPHVKSIRCRPYKLLIYEKDSFFTSHVDTAMDDHQFGTLILSFPLEKEYQGGEFLLHSNKNETITWTPDTTDSKVCEYISYFSDMEHEIKPIKSGKRIVMTLNLFISDDEDISHDVYVTPSHSSEFELNKYYSPYVQQVFDVISACEYCKQLDFPHALIWMVLDYNGEHKAIQLMWTRLNAVASDEGYEDGICIILSHLYQGKDLNPMRLKGEDMHLFRILRQYFGVLLSRVTVKVVIGQWSDDAADSECDYEGRVTEQWETDDNKALRSLHIGDGFPYYNNEHDKLPLELKGRLTRRSSFVVVYNNEALALKHGELQNIYDTVYGNVGAYDIHNLYRCAGLVLTRYEPENEKKRDLEMDKETQPQSKKQKH